MANLDELMLMSSLQSPSEPSVWQDFRSDWANALANLEARTRELRPDLTQNDAEAAQALRESILGPLEAKWGSLLGLPSGRRAGISSALGERGWITRERPDGSLVRVNAMTGEAAPFAEQEQAAPAPSRGGFFYAGSEEGLPLARQRASIGLPSMVGRPGDAGPQREATSLFQGATPAEAIGGGARMVGNFLQEALGLPDRARPQAGPAPAAGNLTGPMAEPSSVTPGVAPRVETLRYGGTNELPVMVFENKSGTHVSRIPQPAGLDARKVIVTRLMADRGNLVKQLTDPFTSTVPARKAEVEQMIKQLDQELAGYGVPMGGGGASSAGGKTLTTEQAREFLRQAGGDKEKARKLARDAGFSL